MDGEVEQLRALVAQLVDTGEAFQRRYRAAVDAHASSEHSATRLDSLARETLRDAEETQTRMAFLLHDTAAQSMVSAHRFLEAARAALAADQPDRAAGHLDAAQERVSEAIREIRRVLDTLVPPGLEELGLAEALRIHLRDRVPATMRWEVTGGVPRAEPWLERGLFAMATEAIDDVVRHSEAATLAVDLRADASRCIITVADDGTGFDSSVPPPQPNEGMGLIGMTRRAGWLGGEVEVVSGPGAGTTVRIAVPLAVRDVVAPEHAR